MKKALFGLVCLVFLTKMEAQKFDPKLTEVWEPAPRSVAPAASVGQPPSDAIVLFDGKNLDQWRSFSDPTKAAAWTLNADGSVTVAAGAGDIRTVGTFGSCQFHLEWREPSVIKGEGQGRGNSGVIFQNRYEVQVLDSKTSKTYANGQCGAIYKQSIPLVNACREAGEWQTYDIIFNAPEFNADGLLTQQPTLTVIQNGVLVQNNFELRGTTEYDQMPKNTAHGMDFLKLQDHGDLISYRNIWLRKL